jgi:dihydrofolate reductase
MVKIESLYWVVNLRNIRGILAYQSEDHPIARTLNAAKKHVASRTLKSLQWNNSSVLDGDIVSAIIALKVQSGHDLQIIGSGNLLQTLQAALLIDEYNVWMYPVVLGRGKRRIDPARQDGHRSDVNVLFRNCAR